MKMIRKISIATVIGKPTQDQAAAKTKLMRVVGYAKSSFKVQSPYGDAHGIMGEFVATNLITGEQTESTKMFLPDIAQEPLLQALDGESAESIAFGFDIGVEPATKDAKEKYIYYCEPLIERSVESPIKRLMDQVAEAKPLPLLDNLASDSAPAESEADTQDDKKADKKTAKKK